MFVCLVGFVCFVLAWLGLAWLGLVWFGLVWFGLVWLGLVWFGLVWFGLVWFGLVWFGLAWFGLVWFGFSRRVSLCSPGCPGTHFVDQAGLELRNLPASAFDIFLNIIL